MAASLDDECEHGSDSLSCVACRNEKPTPTTGIVSRAFEARFDGWCSGCELPISKGQSIRSFETDDSFTYRHDGCQ